MSTVETYCAEPTSVSGSDLNITIEQRQPVQVIQGANLEFNVCPELRQATAVESQFEGQFTGSVVLVYNGSEWTFASGSNVL